MVNICMLLIYVMWPSVANQTSIIVRHILCDRCCCWVRWGQENNTGDWIGISYPIDSSSTSCCQSTETMSNNVDWRWIIAPWKCIIIVMEVEIIRWYMWCGCLYCSAKDKAVGIHTLYSYGSRVIVGSSAFWFCAFLIFFCKCSLDYDDPLGWFFGVIRLFKIIFSVIQVFRISFYAITL